MHSAEAKRRHFDCTVPIGECVSVFGLDTSVLSLSICNCEGERLNPIEVFVGIGLWPALFHVSILSLQEGTLHSDGALLDQLQTPLTVLDEEVTEELDA